MKPYTINEKQITFLDNRFYQAENGSYIPSVTTILQAYPKDAHFYQWLKQVGEDADNIRDEAGRRGSIVHELTERYDAGEEISLITQGGTINYKLSEWAMFERYVQFRELVEPNILNSEFNLISGYYGFAGTIDRIMEINGKNYLIDIKTSNSMHEHYWLQLSAYQMLCEEYYKSTKIIDEVAILWLNAKTRTAGKNGAIQGQGWQLLVRDHAERANDWALFKATHMLWLHQNKTLIPQNKSFTLNHKL